MAHGSPQGAAERQMTNGKKLAASKRSKTLLLTFAHRYGLVTEEYSQIPEDGKALRYQLIRIGDSAVGDGAVIVDPDENPLLVDMYRSKMALARVIRRSCVKNPLMLVLFRDRINGLYDSIGFDVPSYYDGSENPEISSDWGGILKRVGIRHFDGDGDTISFLFPSRDKTSARLALALAGSFERFDEAPTVAPYTLKMSERPMQVPRMKASPN